MLIDVDGYALKLLGDFIFLANACPERMAYALWLPEDSVTYGAGLLKESFDKAIKDARRKEYDRGDDCL